MKNSLLLFIEFYRGSFSLFFGGNCRFEPSCSLYAKEALSQHEVGTALKLIARRLCHCHPFGGEGYDPVPETGRVK